MAARSSLSSLSTYATVYVGNIPWTVGAHDLKQYFSKFVNVVNASVLFNKETGLHRGFGFVILQNRKDLQTVLKHNNYQIDGRILEVKTKELKI